jgi:hypothetical protein
MRILIVGLAATVLAVSAAVALASAAPPTSDPGTPGTAAIGPGPADADGFIGLAAAQAQAGETERTGANHPGLRGRGGGPGFHQITVAAKDGSTLSLKTADGWTRQITVGSDTTITRAGATITIADIRVGDSIAFRQTRNDDGTFKIVEIRVIVPQVAGEVTAVTSSSLTLKLRDGSAKAVVLTGTTKYLLGPRAATQADVKVGSSVVVAGTTSGDTFTALSVTIRLQQVAGDVTAKAADSITIRGRNGSTTTVKVDAATVYRIPGKENATLADVTVGMLLVAQGIRNADNTFSAVTVAAGRGPGDRGPRLPGGLRHRGLPNAPATSTLTSPTNAS